MTREHLDAWMNSAAWLRGAASVRAQEAAAHPPQSDEHRRNAALAADLERRAEAAGAIC